MTKYYIEVVGPYDGMYIGPFTSDSAARAHCASVNRDVFDVTVMTEAEVEANIYEYGAVEIVSPDSFLAEYT